MRVYIRWFVQGHFGLLLIPMSICLVSIGVLRE